MNTALAIAIYMYRMLSTDKIDQKRAERTKKNDQKRAYSTSDSHVVPHRSTDKA
jgi:hypothetical protein